MRPVRVQLRRKKGWRMPPNTVSVARPSKWGNPYKIGVDGTAHECVDKFRWATAMGVLNGFWYPDTVCSALRGKDMACWCPSTSPCHADVLLEIANG